EMHPALNPLLKRVYGVFETSTVSFPTIQGRRSMRTALAERQRATQNHDSGLAEGLGEGDQQRRLRVRASTVGQHQGVAGGSGRTVKKAPNRRIDRCLSEIFRIRADQHF